MDSITASYLANSLTKALLLGLASFVLAMALTPFYTHFAYRYKFWKKPRTTSATGEKLTVLNKLHAAKLKRHFPTAAGLIFVLAISTITLIFNLNRGQTYLPLAALIGGAIVGLIDDLINIRGSGTGVAGLRSSLKFLMMTMIGVGLGWFFFAKLGISDIYIPFLGSLSIGWLIVPFFTFIIVATSNAVNISDGLDGLAGGLLAISFGAFGTIALFQSRLALAGFCFIATGALLSYLWFNIFPARFMMGDVGSFSVGTALGVVAILTDSVFLLPIIGLVFVAEAGSSLIQIFSKKVFKRKIFISAPFHHHLEAKGWPETKITMRLWVIAAIVAFIGVWMALAGGGF